MTALHQSGQNIVLADETGSGRDAGEREQQDGEQRCMYRVLTREAAEVGDVIARNAVIAQ